VTVSDTGHGIVPAVRERMFEAFNTSKESGMGLGLSICRTIVEAHGGRIEASDRPGGGSVFRFTLMRSSGEG
jgi:signal transduction histidine kinase